MPEILKRLARAVAPRFALDAFRRVRLVRRARALRRATEGAGLEERVAAVMALPWFRPIQVPSEITRLCARLADMRPRTIVEIGGAAGGTAYLFSGVAAPDATIVSIDLAYDRERLAAIPELAAAGRRILCRPGDSHAAETRRAVEQLIAPAKIDFLLIDGDHSYEGVKADFELWKDALNDGGLIAFHDVAPDFFTRFGKRTHTDTGGVPRFWTELRARYECEEIVEDPEQDGCGIGVLRWRTPS